MYKYYTEYSIQCTLLYIYTWYRPVASHKKCVIMYMYYKYNYVYCIYQKPKSLVVWEGRPNFSFLFKSCEIDRSQGRLVK